MMTSWLRLRKYKIPDCLKAQGVLIESQDCQALGEEGMM